MARNPYQPTLSDSAKSLKGIRWLRRFAVLNGLMIFIPVLFVVIACLVMAANDVYVSGVALNSAIELVRLIIAYFAIPNCIMLAIWHWTRRSSG